MNCPLELLKNLSSCPEINNFKLKKTPYISKRFKCSVLLWGQIVSNLYKSLLAFTQNMDNSMLKGIEFCLTVSDILIVNLFQGDQITTPYFSSNFMTKFIFQCYFLPFLLIEA